MAFPTTPVLDHFTDASAPRVLSVYDGTDWAQMTNIFTHELKTNADGHCHPDGTNQCGDYWKSASFGPDCEVYATITDATSITLDLWARVANPVSGTFNGYLFQAASPNVNVSLWSPFTTLITFSYTPTNGDVVGMSIVGSTITAYVNGVSKGTASDSHVTAAGFIGPSIESTTGSCDDFGGGTISALLPRSLIALNAVRTAANW